VWRPAAACNRRLGRQGSRPPGTTTWLRGARCDRSACRPKLRRRWVFGERSAAPGSPKPPRWSAERRASRVMGRMAPRKRLACRVMARKAGASHAPERLSALRPPLDWGERSKNAKPGRKTAPRERDGLFDMVNIAIRCAAILCPVVPAQAGTHDHRPVFTGPGSRCARPG
jgi:hypothetical protein